MALHLTPDILRATYELLRVTPPFRGWKLPHADKIEFHVTLSKANSGMYQYHSNGTHIISLSTKLHGALPQVITTLAHEMCHLKQQLTAPQDKAHHGWRFQRMAKKVCAAHRIVPETFG